MNQLKEFSIDGKTYDLTKVAEYISLERIEEAQLALELMTGKTSQDCMAIIEKIKPIAATASNNFKNFPFKGTYYDVEAIMDLLASGDVIEAMNTAQGMGVGTEDSKELVKVLMQMVDIYKEGKATSSDEESENLARTRAADPNWKAPAKCPQCQAVKEWNLVGTSKGGISAGKAVVGAVLLGPIGLAAGALGKKQDVYQCAKCGFTQEYSKSFNKIGY